jgi:uncharacterized membrane protein
MELWFIYALVSLVFAGLHIFIQKIGVARDYNSNSLNSYSAGVSAIFGFVIASFLEGFSELSWWMLLFGFTGGVTYLLSSNFRMDSLRYIDTTISLPLHKFISPLFVLLFGIIIFSEHMTTPEWFGIIFGVLVPLILINQSENERQLDLRKGIFLIAVSASFSAVGAVLYKKGVDIFTSVLLFAAITNGFSSLFGTALYKIRKVNNHHQTNIHALDSKFFTLMFAGGVVQVISFTSFLLALAHGGSLAVVYTITSLYIVIPIVLSVIFYNEHWNARKIVAIVLSILAVALMA